MTTPTCEVLEALVHRGSVIRYRFRLVGEPEPDTEWTPRPGNDPWCEITVWTNAGILHEPDNESLQPTLGSYSGEVWPSAWPALFHWRQGSAQSGPSTRITDDGMNLLTQAIATHQR